MSPWRHHRRQHNIHRAWADFSNAVDTMTNEQRAFVCDSLLAQHRRDRRKIQDAARREIEASIQRTICQDLRILLPGLSSSADNAEGEIMRRAEALAKWPEYQEFIKKDSRRTKYAKQAANVRERRAGYKRREMALPADSMASRVHWAASSSHVDGRQ